MDSKINLKYYFIKNGIFCPAQKILADFSYGVLCDEKYPHFVLRTKRIFGEKVNNKIAETTRCAIAEILDILPAIQRIIDLSQLDDLDVFIDIDRIEYPSYEDFRGITHLSASIRRVIEYYLKIKRNQREPFNGQVQSESDIPIRNAINEYAKPKLRTVLQKNYGVSSDIVHGTVLVQDSNVQSICKNYENFINILSQINFEIMVAFCKISNYDMNPTDFRFMKILVDGYYQKSGYYDMVSGEYVEPYYGYDYTNVTDKWILDNGVSFLREYYSSSGF